MTLSRILPISLLVSALLSPLAAETRGVHDLQDAFVAVARDVGPSVVSISVKGKERGSHFRFGLFMGDPDDSGIGSGVIIASDGHILTNEHVIAKADRILVALSNGKKYRARVVGKDPRSDLAVIKTGPPDPITVWRTLTYTIVVTNNGPYAATGVALIDALPTSVAFVAAITTQGTCAAEATGTVTCDLGDSALAPVPR